MKIKTSSSIDIKGSAKGAVDKVSKTKADIAGAAKGKVSDIAAEAKGKAKDIAGEVKSGIDSAKKGVADKIAKAKAKAAEMKQKCSAAKDKFKDCLAVPEDGWKPNFAASAKIAIGKSFSKTAGITLGDQGKYTLSNYLEINLNIDPNSVESRDDEFTLFSCDGSETFRQVKTIKDDLVTIDDILTLKFEDLDESLNYTLQIDPGKEGDLYYLFENKPYGEWGKE